MKYVFKNPFYKIIIPLLDLLGSILFLPARLFKKPVPKNPKNILVVRLDHIGDFVCTTPVFRNLKMRFPEARITVLTNSASKDLAYRDPDISKVITFSAFYLTRGDNASLSKGLMRVIRDIRNIGFDLGVEPRGDLLSILLMWLGGVRYRAGYGITGGGFLLDKICRYDNSRHVIERNLAVLEALDIPIVDKSPEVYFGEKDKDNVEGLLHRLTTGRQPPRNDGLAAGLSKAIVVHPFAGAKAKEWPRDNFQAIIDRLKKDGHNIILVGSKEDEGCFKNAIDMRGRLSLPQLAYLIKCANFFIGLDSGPANIAAALNAPSIVICSGTNVPQLWIPNNPNVKFVYKDIECKPCENKVCSRQEGNKCISDISVDDVMRVIREIASPAPLASLGYRASNDGQ